MAYAIVHHFQSGTKEQYEAASIVNAYLRTGTARSQA